MITCWNPFCLIVAVLLLGMVLLCMARCLGGVIRARRNGNSCRCCGVRDDDRSDGVSKEKHDV